MSNQPADYEKIWQDFWKEIVCNPDGSINMGQLKKELSDYHVFMGTAAKVYEHITNGAISKINTTAEAIISVADDCLSKAIEESKTEDAFFFDQDGDSHWYMIPTEKRARWNEIAKLEGDEQDDAYNDEFGAYRTGGGIDGIEFIPID